MIKDEVVNPPSVDDGSAVPGPARRDESDPGPNSTEMAIHIGFLRERWAGLFLAGACFILPAVLIVSVFAWAYVRFGSLPEVAAVLYSVKPVIIAVILQAIWGLLKPAVKTRFLAGWEWRRWDWPCSAIDECCCCLGQGCWRVSCAGPYPRKQASHAPRRSRYWSCCWWRRQWYSCPPR